MSDQMVNFPNWEDSGEGGMSVLLVVREPDNHEYHCHVDTHISAHMRRTELRVAQPDAMTSPQRRESLWEDYNSVGFDQWSKTRRTIRDLRGTMRMHFAGDLVDDIHTFAEKAHYPGEYSDTLLAAVQMGSTPLALLNPHYGGYFYAEYTDLTDNGKTIFDGLKLAFGAAPELYTFLDT